MIGKKQLIVFLAAVAEMADCVQTDNWSADLDEVLLNAAQ